MDRVETIIEAVGSYYPEMRDPKHREWVVSIVEKASPDTTNEELTQQIVGQLKSTSDFIAFLKDENKRIGEQIKSYGVERDYLNMRDTAHEKRILAGTARCELDQRIVELLRYEREEGIEAYDGRGRVETILSAVDGTYPEVRDPFHTALVVPVIEKASLSTSDEELTQQILDLLRFARNFAIPSTDEDKEEIREWAKENRVDGSYPEVRNPDRRRWIEVISREWFWRVTNEKVIKLTLNPIHLSPVQRDEQDYAILELARYSTEPK